MRSKEVEVKIDGIPIQDYNGFTSKTFYVDNVGFCRIEKKSMLEEGIFFDGKIKNI